MSVEPKGAAPEGMPEFLSTTQAAAWCGVSAETIRRWIRLKGLPAYNTELGLNIRIRTSDLENFARQHRIYLKVDAQPAARPG
jgi:excisionase family DNA binding protein